MYIHYFDKEGNPVVIPASRISFNSLNTKIFVDGVETCLITELIMIVSK